MSAQQLFQAVEYRQALLEAARRELKLLRQEALKNPLRHLGTIPTLKLPARSEF